MNTFTSVFLLFLYLMLATELWLAWRQARHVAGCRRAVPGAFRGKVPLAAHKKAADYTIVRTRLGAVGDVYGAALLLAWTVGGGLEWLDGQWRGAGMDDLFTGAAFLLSAFLIMSLLELPLVLYRTFVVENRFGFNRTTPVLFAADLARKTALFLLLGTPVFLAALWLMRETGALWWVFVWVLWVAVGLFMVWAYPALIAPLFNRFTPLGPGALRSRILRLLRRTGFRSRGIYVVDSSRRTAHGNAYFTGLGKSKRIVFFDNLLKSLNIREVESVLAHELGHFKRGHVYKRMLLVFILGLAGLAVLGGLAAQSWFYRGLGLTQPSAHAALILFILTGPVFTFFLQPLIAWGSRRHEYEADRFAAATASARALAGALVKLYRDNASTLTPDPVHSAFYDTHPPAGARIARLVGKT
jgi:STE24 endopeptidase